MQTSRPRTERTETGTRQPAHGRTAARREASQGAAAPPPLTADVLRAAQRGAGNAAVTAMIARRAAGGPAEERPDTGVHEVLRSAGRPLAPPVRQDMESRFGTDFSDVRLHTGAAAARSARAIGARAYTSGSHVVIGDGGGDRHTLAHELTHVVQQRQGPVSGADRGDGLRISDPSDRFERAAEENARRVLSGPRPADADPHDHGPRPVSGAEPADVQRKVGFEFEVADTGWKFYEDNRLKKDSKASLIDLGEGLAYVSADNGNVEFVTRPLATLEDVRKALADIVAFHDRLSREGSYEEGSYTIKARGPGKGVPQATFGVKMENVENLVEVLENMNRRGDEPPPSKSRRTARNTNAGKTDEAEIIGRVSGVLPGLGDARAHSREIVDRLARDDSGEPLEAGVQKEVTGFLTVILKTLYDIEGKSAANEDPKYFFSMMPRTDFVSMRDSLSDEAAQWLTGRLEGLYATMQDVVDDGIDGPLFPGRYKEKPKGKGPTRLEWLDSVFRGAPGAKDLLSPPPGYPQHSDTPVPEGVGAMSTDNEGLSLFELRDLGKPLAKESWPALAEFIAKKVGEATGDARLQEQRDQ